MTKAYKAPEGFLFGCDPELFVFDQNGVAVSAHGLIPGTKEEPHRVEKGAVQVDGMAAEFNIDPVDNFDDFNDSINTVMGQLRKMLPAGHTLQAIPSVEFSPEVFDAAPDIAKELGCSPDFNAWTGEVNSPPDTSKSKYLRTASGHLHIGWRPEGEMDAQHIMNCNDLVRQLDWFLGAWSLGIDTDARRRILYGKAGACRYKEYGVEYRVLSNFWLTSKDRRLATWNRMIAAIDAMRSCHIPERVRNSDWNEKLIASIDTSRMDPSLSSIARYPIRTLDSMYSHF